MEGISTTRLLPPVGKDWNDAVKAMSAGNKPSLIGRLEAAKTEAAEHNAQSGTNLKGITPEWR